MGFEERKSNMGHEKGDVINAYYYELLVGEDFFDEQYSTGPISDFGCGIDHGLEAA
jgi:hypothetical protein